MYQERQVAMYQEVGVSAQACKEPNLLSALLSSATPTTSRPLGIQVHNYNHKLIQMLQILNGY